jgi:Cu-Zn family superoxide dismutase
MCKLSSTGTLGGALIATLAAAAAAGCESDKVPSLVDASVPGGGMMAAADAGAREAGAAEAGAVKAKAEAKLDPTSMASTVKGTAKFEHIGDQVTLELKIEGATPGLHAVHIHENGQCGTTTDAMTMMPVPGGAAGGHWNPTTAMHGRLEMGSFHLGDIGNVTIGADGKGEVRVTTKVWTIGTGMANDIVGKSVVFHAMPDDFMTQPTGGAGGRQACGVIDKVAL